MRLHMKKKKKKWIRRSIIIGVVVIAAAAAVMSLANTRAPDYTTEVVRARDIETFYSFSGNIAPDKFEIVAASVSAKINRIYYEENDTILKDSNIMRSQAGQLFEAPINGTITDIYIEADDSVKPGDPLFRVASYDKPIVIISIDEYDIGSITIGEQVTVYIQAMDRTYTGVIDKVDKEATITGNVAYYSAKIAIEQDGYVRMGMTCEVAVPKQSALNAATISLSSVKFDEDNKPFIYTYNGNQEVVAEYITLGVNNGTYTEVLEGLKLGETVLIPKNNAPMFMAFQNMRFR